MYASSYLAIDCYTVEEALNLYTLSNYTVTILSCLVGGNIIGIKDDDLEPGGHFCILD